MRIADWDRYSYTRNNPINYNDPTGHSVDCGIGESGECRARVDIEKRIAYLDQERERCAHNSRGINCPDYLGMVGLGIAILSAPEIGIVLLDKLFTILEIGTATSVCVNENCVQEAESIIQSIKQNISEIPASKIYFTQDSILPNTKLGVYLDDLTQEISNGYFRGSLRVVEFENRFYSLDNRRLAAFKLLDINVPVTIESLTDPNVQMEFLRKFTTINDPNTQNGLRIFLRGIGIYIP